MHSNCKAIPRSSRPAPDYFESPSNAKVARRRSPEKDTRRRHKNTKYYESPTKYLLFSPGDTISEVSESERPHDPFFCMPQTPPSIAHLFRPLTINWNNQASREAKISWAELERMCERDDIEQRNDCALESDDMNDKMYLGFSTDAEFRQFFSSHPEIMRILCTRYTSAETVEEIAKLPMFHRENKVPDEAISDYFFKTFTVNSFALDGQKVVCIDPKLMDVEVLCSTRVREHESDLCTRLAQMKALKLKHNAAIKAEKRQLYLAQDAKARAIRNVYSYVRSSTSQSLSADGGDTNAELTQGSAQQLIEYLIKADILHEHDVFMDGGAAYNTFASHVAQVAKCRTWGVEYVTTRFYIATANMLNAFADPQRHGELVNPKIAYAPLNLYSLTMFGPTTLAYFFDEAFPIALIEHNVLVAANTPGLVYILSYKASKRRSVHGIFERFGFVRQDAVKVKKCGGEHNTVYIYKRSDCAVPLSEVEPTRACSSLTKEMLMQKYLDPAWSDDPNVRRCHYEALHHEAENRLLSTRRQQVPWEPFCSCTCCQYRSNRRNVLCLGMIYADTTATNTDGVAHLVKQGEMTPQIGRDTARCLAMEAHHNVNVYTLAVENDAPARSDRHITATFSGKNTIDDIKSVVPQGEYFEQIALDYFWMPKGYLHDRIGRRMLRERLVGFAEEVLKPGGSVYFPFHIDVLRRLAGGESLWKTYYDISFIRRDDEAQLRQHILWSATHTIPKETMHGVFEKEPGQETLYCRVHAREVLSAQLPPSSHISALLAGILDDIEEYRFVCLCAKKRIKNSLQYST